MRTIANAILSLTLLGCSTVAPPWFERPAPPAGGDAATETTPDREPQNLEYVDGGEGVALTRAPQAEVNRPLPVGVMTVVSDVDRIMVRYKSPSMSSWRAIELTNREGFYSVQLPCVDLSDEGVLEYYVVVIGGSGAPVARAGSPTKPFQTKLTRDIGAGPWALPTEPAPKKCAPIEDERNAPAGAKN